jgi:hypothetical protein
MSRSKSVLLPLLEQLKRCESHEEMYSGDLLKERWEYCKGQRIENNKPSLSILTALILDSNFSNLLNREESTQLFRLARLALQRYEEKNKITKVGRILHDSITEEEEES